LTTKHNIHADVQSIIHTHTFKKYKKPVLILAMQAVRGEEYRSFSFLTSALDGGEW
jgi:hypothetical protein